MMFQHDVVPAARAALLAGVLASSAFALSAGAQSPAPAKKPAVAANPTRYRPNRLPARALMYYESVWGVDSLSVKLMESGEMVRFSWRVVDPDRAKILHDKKLKPSLIDPQAAVRLVVPEVDMVGQLRQTSTPIAGRSYWVAFSNRGRPVRHGDHVTVEIGQFRAAGLVVE